MQRFSNRKLIVTTVGEVLLLLLVGAGAYRLMQPSSEKLPPEQRRQFTLEKFNRHIIPQEMENIRKAYAYIPEPPPECTGVIESNMAVVRRHMQSDDNYLSSGDLIHESDPVYSRSGDIIEDTYMIQPICRTGFEKRLIAEGYRFVASRRFKHYGLDLDIPELDPKAVHYRFDKSSGIRP